MDSKPTTITPRAVGLPAILVVTCSSSNSNSSSSSNSNSPIGHLPAVEENPVVEVEEKIPTSTGSPENNKTVADDCSATEVVATTKTPSEHPPAVTTETELGHVHSMAKTPKRTAAAAAVAVSVKFCTQSMPRMSGKEPVRYLSHFRLGDTYKLKNRNWLLPQFLSGVLTLVGVVLTLVGIISLQINKYLHACDADDGVDCQSNKANINNIMMPIGVGSTGGGLSLILISGFIFVHAFCVIYEDGENEDEDTQDGVLHIPASQRATLLGSTSALAAEASLARCHSYYDNLEYHVAL